MPCGSAKDTSHADKNGEGGHCAFQDLDHSLLQHSLTLGPTNVKQILKSFQNGSKEIRDLLLNECNIIYECSVCANLFRSLANFLYHKRCYCKKHLCEDMRLFDDFEEDAPTLVVQPEPPNPNLEKSPMNSAKEMQSTSPTIVQCTVDLVKTDLIDEENNLVPKDKTKISSGKTKVQKEKTGKNKNCQAKKDQIDEGKKSMEEESPMISRRTREKNRRTVKFPEPDEPPKKVSKLTKVIYNPKAFSEYAMKQAKQNETEAVNDSQIPDKDSTIVNLSSEIDVEESRKADTEVSKEPVNETVKEVNKDTTVELNEEFKADIEIVKEVPATEKAHEMIAKDESKEVVAEMDQEPKKDENKQTGEGGEKETSKILEKEKNKAFSTQLSIEIENKKPIRENVENLHKVEYVQATKKMFIKPVKKIIIAKPPKSGDLPSCSVFDSFQKSPKIGFTSITSAGKNLQCFPKIIFKTIDGNPHAVFQASENSKTENISSKGTVDNSVVQSKSDSEKLIIVLKKDSIKPPSVEVKQISKSPVQEKVSKSSKNQTEFHLTRRKRLLARNDCNVQELKCLSCNARFTSIKTLYFHMLSIHSKKRLYFPCPICKTLFVQMYGVTRHLISIHNKTKDQINKLRDSIKKKSIWKKVDEVNATKGTNETESKFSNEFRPESKIIENVMNSNNPEGSNLKTVLKIGKNVPLHRCSKCNRGFERKSSQVSHEKFCIMNAIQLETVDLGGGPISPPPNVSFLSLSPKPANVESHFYKPSQQPSSIFKISSRPKRGAEKQMHKDFVNSQTLKWRSANRIDTHARGTSPIKKGSTKNLEKKVANIMNVENLLCMKCDKRFSSYSNLRRHVAIHVGWTRFKCKYCEYQAYNKSQCCSHVQKAHEVPDDQLDKSIINLSGNSLGKKLPRSTHLPKRTSDVRVKQISPKANGIPKVKISKKKATIQEVKDIKGSLTKSTPEKKHYPPLKKGNLDSKKEETKKESIEIKKEKSPSFGKDTIEVKKSHNIDNKKKEKILSMEHKKEILGAKREKTPAQENKNVVHVKKETDNQSALTSIFRSTVSSSNYKSVTTNNPTTIILSKKSSTPTVQSIMAISTESMSSNTSNKTMFPVRSSPRNNESKVPEENNLTSLVTRSSAYAKPSSTITLKMPMRSNSMEDLKKNIPQFPEKTYAKKDRLISEWFPKKDLNSNNSRRESAPLIIGLVAASSSGLNARAKNPAISYERTTSS